METAKDEINQSLSLSLLPFPMKEKEGYRMKNWTIPALNEGMPVSHAGLYFLLKFLDNNLKLQTFFIFKFLVCHGHQEGGGPS